MKAYILFPYYNELSYISSGSTRLEIKLVCSPVTIFNRDKNGQKPRGFSINLWWRGSQVWFFKKPLNLNSENQSLSSYSDNEWNTNKNGISPSPGPSTIIPTS
jgi:hypothetical protein